MNFKEFYATTNKTYAEFAKWAGISESYVIKLVYAIRCPSPVLMEKLRKLSNGQITADDCQRAYIERLNQNQP